jgi:hypothetical protein
MPSLNEIATIHTGYARGSYETHPGGQYQVIEPRHISAGRAHTGHMSAGEDEASPKGVRRPTIAYDALARTDELTPSERHLIREGDVLFVPRGQSMAAALVDRPLERAVASSQLYVIRAGDEVLPAYLAWQLGQERAQHYFQAMGRGSTVPSVNKRVLSELTLPVPSLQRQQAIARIAALAGREAQLAAQLQERRSELIHSSLQRAAQ